MVKRFSRCSDQTWGQNGEEMQSKIIVGVAPTHSAWVTVIPWNREATLVMTLLFDSHPELCSLSDFLGVKGSNR